MFIQALLLDGLIVMALFTAGFLAVKVIQADASPLLSVSLSFPLGAGILTWLFFVLGWMGLPFDRSRVILIWLVLVGILIFALQKRTPMAWKSWLKVPVPRGFGLAISASLLGILLCAVLVAVGRSYSMYDAIAMWAPKGYGIALEGSIWGAKWGGHGLAYPLHIHFLIALFKLFSGDVLPGSKVIFPLFFVSLLAAMVETWRVNHVRSSVRLSGMLLAASVPTLFLHATVGYANLPMGVYLILGSLLAIRGMEEGQKSLQTLSGLFFGLTIWTIIEGVLYVLVVIAGLVIARWISKKGRVFYTAWLVPVLIFGVSWFTFYRLYGYSGSQVSNASTGMLYSLLHGEWHLNELRLIIGYARRNIFDLSTWGVIFPLGMVLLFIGWREIRPKGSFQGFALACCLAFTGLLSIALFYLRSFDIPGLYDLLVRGFPRGFITPTLFLLILAVQVSKSIWPEPEGALPRTRADGG